METHLLNSKPSFSGFKLFIFGAVPPFFPSISRHKLPQHLAVCISPIHHWHAVAGPWLETLKISSSFNRCVLDLGKVWKSLKIHFLSILFAFMSLHKTKQSKHVLEKEQPVCWNVRFVISTSHHFPSGLVIKNEIARCELKCKELKCHNVRVSSNHFSTFES